ncbi:MAG: subclass B3 metallo-beta-lactamase [Lysobacterales bacterium]
MKLITALLLLVTPALASAAPTASSRQSIDCHNCAEWNRPRAPFALFGGSHYVGPEGLSVVAIDTGAGVIVIDAALPQSVDGIVANLRRQGLDIADVKYIAISHPHFDHVGGVAALARLSGATVLSTDAGVRALRQGNVPDDDPQAAFDDSMRFPPVAKLRSLDDGESITLGDTTLTLHATPGHTPGGASWSWRDCEADRCIDLVYADSLTPIAAGNYRFSTGEREAVFRASIARLRRLPCDLLVSAHPSFSRLFERQAQSALIDSGACRAYAQDAAQALTKRLQQERQSAPAP